MEIKLKKMAIRVLCGYSLALLGGILIGKGNPAGIILAIFGMFIIQYVV